MNIREWSKSEVDYGRKLVDSVFEGARRAENEYLRNESFGSNLRRSIQHATTPALVGACLGLFGGFLDKKRSTSKTLLYGLLGGAIGFGAGLAWDNRKLTASVASGAWQSVNRTRDDRWLEKNPIDYA